MTTQELYEGIRHVVRITTESSSASCEHCHHEEAGLHRFPKMVNHYIERHGYRLLHIGTETTEDSKANHWHTTIAVLGKETGDLGRI